MNENKDTCMCVLKLEIVFVYIFFIYIELIKLLEADAHTNRVDRTLDEDLLLLVSGDDDGVHQKLMAESIIIKKSIKKQIQNMRIFCLFLLLLLFFYFVSTSGLL